MSKAQKKSLWETFKFTARLVILVGLPLVTERLLQLEGVWGEVAAAVLPIVDKWAHESPDIKVNGLLPF